MKSKFCYFLLSFFVLSIDANRYRCDYTYFKDAGGYLKYQEIPVTWEEARIRCALEGTILASPLTPALRDAIIILTNITCPRGVWTGINSLFSKGDYSSVEGVALSDIPHSWMKCEPDNYENKENCLVMQPSGDLADAKCNETLPYVCYKKVYPGMGMNSCGSADNAYTFDKRTNKCYKYHSNPRIWSQAYMSCKAEGGQLAVINSDAEDQILKDLFNKGPSPPSMPNVDKEIIFLGFTDWNNNGEWRTINGETLQEAGWDKWAPSQPSGNQYCGGMFKSGLIDDSTCSARAPFICEKNPETLMCDHEKRK